jgi:hypothetical protein
MRLTRLVLEREEEGQKKKKNKKNVVKLRE